MSFGQNARKSAQREKKVHRIVQILSEAELLENQDLIKSCKIFKNNSFINKKKAYM